MVGNLLSWGNGGGCLTLKILRESGSYGRNDQQWRSWRSNDQQWRFNEGYIVVKFEIGINDAFSMLERSSSDQRRFYSELEAHQVATYHEGERQDMLQLLETYNQMCQNSGVLYSLVSCSFRDTKGGKFYTFTYERFHSGYDLSPDVQICNIKYKKIAKKWVKWAEKVETCPMCILYA